MSNMVENIGKIISGAFKIILTKKGRYWADNVAYDKEITYVLID